MDGGWSIKKLIKKIVLTETYQRSSHYDEQKFRVDAENKLLWRMTPRQLDAESLRDSMLAVGGILNLDRPYASEVAPDSEIFGLTACQRR